MLIEKPRKNGDCMGAPTYRPICLFDAMGKVFEKILVGRLTQELENWAALSNRQYGFRRGMSAIDAMRHVVRAVKRVTEKASQHKGLCVLIALDIENAFNTAR